MAIVTEISDAVVARLNELFAGQFVAMRQYQASLDLEDAGDLHVTVVPRGVQIESASRTTLQRDCQIDIAVRQKVAIDRFDSLMDLTERVIEIFRSCSLTLSDGRRGVWVKTENAPIFSAEHLEQFGQFTSVVTLTFRVIA